MPICIWMKNFISLLFILSFLSCAQVRSIKRAPAFVPTNKISSCLEPFTMALKYKANPEDIVHDLLEWRYSYDQPIILDIGGEGRYVGAINLNPQPITSTTGEAGRIIPNWVPGMGIDIPFPKKVVDIIHLENAPINTDVMWEMQRVMRPRGEIHLSHPREYADSYYEKLKSIFKDAHIERVNNGIISEFHITMP